MNFPTNLRYTAEHEWIRVEGNIGYIGITDFAQGELGDIVYVEVETTGESLEQNQIFGTIEAVKTTSELYMPVAGKVLEFNSMLASDGEDNPALVNTDPYGDGWIIKIELSDPAQVDALMDAKTYQEKVA